MSNCTMYCKYLCLAALAGVLVTGAPSLARDAYDDAVGVSVLSELVGIEDVSAVAATKYCGSQASGCDHWTDDGTPGKGGSPTGICSGKEHCSEQGKGKGGKDCLCCGRYKDGDGKTQDCPPQEQSVNQNVLSVF